MNDLFEIKVNITLFFPTIVLSFFCLMFVFTFFNSIIFAVSGSTENIDVIIIFYIQQIMIDLKTIYVYKIFELVTKEIVKKM